jgi:hypothetical protein
VANRGFTCGYHTNNLNLLNFDEVYGAIAYPIGNCKLNTPSYPIGSSNTDTAVSIGSHELFESVSDPLGEGWCDDSGYFSLCFGGEIGDKCNDVFAAKDSSNGDLSLNGDEYLVQEEWSNRAPLSATELDEDGQLSIAANKCTMS